MRSHLRGHDVRLAAHVQNRMMIAAAAETPHGEGLDTVLAHVAEGRRRRTPPRWDIQPPSRLLTSKRPDNSEEMSHVVAGTIRVV